MNNLLIVMKATNSKPTLIPSTKKGIMNLDFRQYSSFTIILTKFSILSECEIQTLYNESG